MVNEPSSYEYLDLRGTPCPLNFIRCRLALEELKPNELLKVDLDKGEPYEMVFNRLKKDGHSIEILFEDRNFVCLLVDSFGKP